MRAEYRDRSVNPLFEGLRHGISTERISEMPKSINPMLICGTCKKMYWDPQECEKCSTTFCLPCMRQHSEEEEVKESNNPTLNEKQYCPVCKETTPFEAVKFLSKKITNTYKFKCIEEPSCKSLISYKDLPFHLCGQEKTSCQVEGCVWEGEVRKRVAHENECEFRMVECSNSPDCNMRVRAKYMAKHREECPWQLISCPNGCNMQFQQKERESHNTKCTHKLIACKYKLRGCKATRKSWDLAQHESICDFQPIGTKCKHQVNRKDIESHESECPYLLIPCPECTYDLPRKDLANHRCLPFLRSKITYLEEKSKETLRLEESKEILRLEEKSKELWKMVYCNYCRQYLHQGNFPECSICREGGRNTCCSTCAGKGGQDTQYLSTCRTCHKNVCTQCIHHNWNGIQNQRLCKKCPYLCPKCNRSDCDMCLCSFCRESSCSSSFGKCTGCRRWYCATCSTQLKCDICHVGWHCNGAETKAMCQGNSCQSSKRTCCVRCLKPCIKCNKNYCTNCLIKCASCNQTTSVCNSCRTQDISCYICNQQTCMSCKRDCLKCKRKVCSRCVCMSKCGNCKTCCPPFQTISQSQNSSRCSSCHQNICTTNPPKQCGSCSYSMCIKCIEEQKCSICKNSICQNCQKKCQKCPTICCNQCATKDQERCMQCQGNISHRFCEKCKTGCHECKKKLCQNCEKICPICHQISCSTCAVESICIHCNKAQSWNHCEKCIKNCNECKKKLCTNCDKICPICSQISCSTCAVDSICIHCNKAQSWNYCEKCTKSCDECKKKLCQYCQKICPKCSKISCPTCLAKIICIHCNNTKSGNYCKKCVICDKCNKEICNCLLSQCAKCNSVYCKNCLQKCHQCSKSYCSECSENLIISSVTKQKYCSSCIYKCPECSSSICRKDLPICRPCSKPVCDCSKTLCAQCNLYICPSCIKPSNCPKCKAQLCKYCHQSQINPVCNICFPFSIHHQVPIADLLQAGFEMVKDTHVNISIHELRAILTKYGNNKLVCVGAIKPGREYLELCAFGLTNIVFKETQLNYPQQLGNVFWYMTNFYGFGFAPKSKVNQYDIDEEEPLDTNRLSWTLGINDVGMRVGDQSEFIGLGVIMINSTYLSNISLDY